MKYITSAHLHMHIFMSCFVCFQRYEIVNGVVEVDGVAKEPSSEKAAEGEDSDGTESKLTLPVCIPILICDCAFFS